MRNSKDVIIGLLIERLGGEVKITAEDYRRATDLEITEWEDLPDNGYRYTTARPEIVPDAPQAIEPPPACFHPFDTQHWTFEGDMICGSCGATTGHDEQMRVRSINAGLIE